jgi:hypothetical protein
MSFSAGGTERMRLDSSANLGVGTTTVTANLDLAADDIVNGVTLRLKNVHNGSDWALDSKLGVIDFYSTDASAAGVKGSIELIQSSSSTTNPSATDLVFKTYGGGSISEKMRITSGGYLKVSNTGSYGSASSNHEMKNTTNGNTITNFYHSGTDPYGLFAYFDGASPNNTSNYFAYFRDVTEAKLTIFSNGNVQNLNNSYGAFSDAKLKENVVDASPKLDDLMQVKIRNYNLIGSDKKQLGVVAQELEEVFPSMIDESPDFEERQVEVRDEEGNIVYKTEQVEVTPAELDEEGNVISEAVYETIVTDEPEMTTERFDLGTVTKSVKYSVFVPMLIKAIQEQQEIIDGLKARIEALEG